MMFFSWSVSLMQAIYDHDKAENVEVDEVGSFKTADKSRRNAITKSQLRTLETYHCKQLIPAWPIASLLQGGPARNSGTRADTVLICGYEILQRSLGNTGSESLHVAVKANIGFWFVAFLFGWGVVWLFLFVSVLDKRAIVDSWWRKGLGMVLTFDDLVNW